MCQKLYSAFCCELKVERNAKRICVKIYIEAKTSKVSLKVPPRTDRSEKNLCKKILKFELIDTSRANF